MDGFDDDLKQLDFVLKKINEWELEPVAALKKEEKEKVIRFRLFPTPETYDDALSEVIKKAEKMIERFKRLQKPLKSEKMKRTKG